MLRRRQLKYKDNRCPCFATFLWLEHILKQDQYHFPNDKCESFHDAKVQQEPYKSILFYQTYTVCLNVFHRINKDELNTSTCTNAKFSMDLLSK